MGQLANLGYLPGLEPVRHERVYVFGAEVTHGASDRLFLLGEDVVDARQIHRVKTNGRAALGRGGVGAHVGLSEVGMRLAWRGISGD